MNITRLAGLARVLNLDLNELISMAVLPPELPEPHDVRVQGRAWAAGCLTCGADLGWSPERSEMLERKHGHIAAMQKAEADDD